MDNALVIPKILLASRYRNNRVYLENNYDIYFFKCIPKNHLNYKQYITK